MGAKLGLSPYETITDCEEDIVKGYKKNFDLRREVKRGRR
jgi:hypothetical protein